MGATLDYGGGIRLGGLHYIMEVNLDDGSFVRSWGGGVHKTMRLQILWGLH